TINQPPVVQTDRLESKGAHRMLPRDVDVLTIQRLPRPTPRKRQRFGWRTKLDRRLGGDLSSPRVRFAHALLSQPRLLLKLRRIHTARMLAVLKQRLWQIREPSDLSQAQKQVHVLDPRKLLTVIPNAIER